MISEKGTLFSLGLVVATFFFMGMIPKTNATSGDDFATGTLSSHETLVVSNADMPVAHVDDDGKKTYTSKCLSCHQANGKGIPGAFPPLAASEWVTGDKGRLIRLTLHGISGKITVGGVVYGGAMPPWGPFLDDEEMAGLLTFIRSEWGNSADAVTADEVSRVRKATVDRKKPWTAEELSKFANFGVPKK